MILNQNRITSFLGAQEERDMTFNPQQFGFTWPQETTLTNATGETMVIRPDAVKFVGLRDAKGQRIEECYRYYTSSGGDMTELEVKTWLAGGPEVCARLLAAFRALLGEQPGTPLSLSSVISSLESQGFSDSTIEIILRWLLHDGYIAGQRSGDDWMLKVIKE